MDDDADVIPVDDSATTIDDLRIAYSLNDCCVAEVRHLAEHYVEYVATPSADRAALAAGWDAHHLHHAAEHGNAAPAFAAFLRETSGNAREVVDGYADALATHDELAAFATYVRARAALAAGIATDAFAEIERSVDADGDFLPALDLYATLLADGGRPVEALAVRKRITSLGAPPGDMNALQDILRQSSKIGRNDPCPCGSGRKYKQCCQRDPKVGPADRRRLALHQAVRHAIGPDGGYRDLYALGITAATAAAPTGRARAEIFQRVVADPFLVDLTLHEGGRLDAYLAERGDLVPADEVAWLRALAATSLGLWAHERADDGTYRLTNRIADFTLDGVVFPPGAVPDADSDLLGRVVADGIDGRPSTIGPVMLVSAARRDGVVELIERSAGADAWAEWFGALVGTAR